MHINGNHNLLSVIKLQYEWCSFVLGLCNTVIDNPGRLDKPRLVKEILSFLETDTVLFYGEEPPELLQAQIQKWSPIILWFRDRFGVTIEPTTDVMAAPVTQCVYPRLDVTCADGDMLQRTCRRWRSTCCPRATRRCRDSPSVLTPLNP